MTLPTETGALGILWLFRLDAEGPVKPEPLLPATLMQAGPEVADELAQTMQFDDPAPVLQRFARGRQCYIARVAGRLVAYGWITYDQEEIGELGLRIRLNQAEAYIWDCGTLPEYRGRRLYPALLAHMLDELQHAGIRRAWIGTDADNLPSQRGVARVGSQRTVEIMQGQDGVLMTRGSPGAPRQDVLDAHYALFGNRDSSHIIFLEPHE